MSDDKEVKKDELQVAEQQDGSVTVEGIEDIPEENEGGAPQQKAEGGQAVPEDGGEDHPDDTEAMRSARREKRKAKKLYHREQQKENKDTVWLFIARCYCLRRIFWHFV